MGRAAKAWHLNIGGMHQPVHQQALRIDDSTPQF